MPFVITHVNVGFSVPTRSSPGSDIRSIFSDSEMSIMTFISDTEDTSGILFGFEFQGNNEISIWDVISSQESDERVIESPNSVSFLDLSIVFIIFPSVSVKDDLLP